jgi:2',3'-cyclic-nucleotide 2'-phosphodiesterase (5'-nucleotidase family)
MLLTYGHDVPDPALRQCHSGREMTGAQIYELLNQSATLFKGAPASGVRYKFFRYADELPGPQPYAWGAYDVEVYGNKRPAPGNPLDLSKTYKVATNEFLAPAGQDGFTPSST